MVLETNTNYGFSSEDIMRGFVRLSAIAVTALFTALLSFPHVSATSVTPAVAGGAEHTCYLNSAGGVQCWGWNNVGQLGDGTLSSSSVPVSVTGLPSDVVGITAGANGEGHTCALTSAGGVKCWGLNQYGQLGNNSFTNSSVPVDVVGLASPVVAIAAGGLHTCALTTAGGIECWGRNQWGTLGDGTNTNSSVPVSVAGLGQPAVSVTGGGDHTCAILADQAVKCWGYNGFGELGNGSNVNSLVPVPVSGLSAGSGASALTAGGGHSCALLSGGQVKCWGFNTVGSLGNGSFANSNVPTSVAGLAGSVTALTASGGYHTCALLAGGAMQC